jgi:acetoin utilization deacetylase AcuC-like enzyme
MVNIALPPYSDGKALHAAVLDHWLPALVDFEPQLLLISAGFDAHRDDPLAQLGWVEADYAWATAELVDIANQYADGRIVSMLEGGYDLNALARSAEAHLRALLEV